MNLETSEVEGILLHFGYLVINRHGFVDHSGSNRITSTAKRAVVSPDEVPKYSYNVLLM